VIKEGVLFNDKMKEWTSPDSGDEHGAQKSKIASLTAGIDRTRRDVVMVGFKLRAVQGKPEEAGAMLEALKTAGGNIEVSQSSLELMARELAAQIPVLKKENKLADAKLLGDGLAILLRELAAIPNRPTSSTLFIGQTLLTVEQHEDAIKEFDKIPVPTIP